ncbi:truncated transferrin-binding protein 1 [Actinobacillus lignieresii]|nr:TonB-dependent receptor plug domain-containing protein [Actinobacillus lignieresii]SUT97998.1 truncated transferrin-binding protein 1 [Actinobacillus lignieresii]
MKQFKLSLSYIAVQSAFLILSAQTYAKQTETELGTVTVKAKTEVHRRQNEVTGLGKVTKTSKDLDKEQVQNIRDLTRYDPGISVVEQGRGASSGYSIRGVDRNRVALLVDGLPQIQSYKSLSPFAQGGAINEIEYENIRSIEFSKGASSQEYGSGALGGAVGFRTKNPDDVIKEGQNWGLDSKTAYSSKNKQFSESLSFAGRAGGFEALVQYTHRKGKETEIHKDATNVR